MVADTASPAPRSAAARAARRAFLAAQLGVVTLRTTLARLALAAGDVSQRRPRGGRERAGPRLRRRRLAASPAPRSAAARAARREFLAAQLGVVTLRMTLARLALAAGDVSQRRRAEVPSRTVSPVDHGGVAEFFHLISIRTPRRTPLFASSFSLLSL